MEIKPYVFNIYLKVETKRIYGDQIAFHKWENFTLHQVVRWDWYFKYRAALYQVKYPKAYVTISQFKKDAEGTQLKNAYRGKWISKKAKITEMKNKIARARSKYNELFPIEDQKVYQDAVAKLKRLELEFIALDKLYQESLNER